MRRPVICLLIITIVSPAFLKAQELPSSKTMEALAAISSNFEPVKKGISNNWPYSEYFKGLYAYYKISSDTAILNKILFWGKLANWDLPGGKSTKNAADMSCGQTYIDMYLLDRYKEERIKNIRACADLFMKEKTAKIDNSDELSMVLPVFAGLATIYNNDKYYEQMEALFLSMRDTLHFYDPEEHLWISKEKDSEYRYTAENNGQVLAALVKTLESLSSGRYKKDYESMLKEMAETLVPLQKSDGYWNESLKDSTGKSENDLLATSMIIYGIAGGINNGILNRKDYQPVVTKSWESVISGLIRSDGSVAFPSVKDDQLARLTGSLLMAGSEMYTLQKSVEPKVKPKKVKEEDVKKKPEGNRNVKEEGKAGKEGRGDKKKK